MKTGSDLHLDPITDDMVQENAGLAAARGAALLDRRDPSWFDKLTEPIVSEVTADAPMLVVQLGVIPDEDTPHEERKTALEAFLIAQDGEGPLFESGYEDEDERIIALLGAMLKLKFVCLQETLTPSAPAIDLAAHGFAAEFPVLGLGQPGGYVPTPEDDARDGFCIDKAAQFLADAWNDEINARKEVKR